MKNNTNDPQAPEKIVRIIQEQLQDLSHLSQKSGAIFFKTAPGDYAEHDRFLGISTPVLRKIAKTHCDLHSDGIILLLQSPLNEERLLALMILVSQYQKAKSPEIQDAIYSIYYHYRHCVNNWNLVDASAHHILGAHLYSQDREVLCSLVRSNSLWDRRIAIVATWYFIKKNDFEWTLNLAQHLLNDKQDLIHKAVGWMLRELGKRDLPPLLDFLNKNASLMPRTMLRYAIEKLDPKQRKEFLER